MVMISGTCTSSCKPALRKHVLPRFEKPTRPPLTFDRKRLYRPAHVGCETRAINEEEEEVLPALIVLDTKLNTCPRDPKLGHRFLLLLQQQSQRRWRRQENALILFWLRPVPPCERERVGVRCSLAAEERKPHRRTHSTTPTKSQG